MKRTFWGCSRYPECDFISNYKPVNETCASCGNNYLEVHWKKDEGEFKKCPKCHTTYPVATTSTAETSS
jgi:DNA topoisomerase-1